MLDSYDIDPTDSAYSQQGPLAGLESIATKIMASLSLGHDINRGRRLDGINDLTIAQVRALLAYKYWDDGADDEQFVLSVWKTDNAWTRDRVIETLVEVFGFTK